MINQFKIFIALTASLCLCNVVQARKVEGSIGKEHLSELPLGAIKPKGWLLHQCQIMRDGSTGHLDEVYWKIKNSNGWLGGVGDGWEETPYWLDGAVPLAYLLDDEKLKQKVLQYINWTIENQRPSGYFGPITKWERETGNKITVATADKGEDWWPKMVMLKVLQQYYTATKDERVIGFMNKYFDYQLSALKTVPLGKWSEWATSRGADNTMIVMWLYQHTQKASLLELSKLLQQQSYKWSDLFASRDWVINAAAYQNNDKWMQRHGVNVAMGLKDPMVEFQRTGDTGYISMFKTGFHDLMSLHGLPFGMFSADEDLHGNNPIQGTELCAIVEAMFSLEQVIAITGSTHYADALERMTFNALPTQTTDDYNSKQYFQIANQVQISRGVFNFSLPFNHEMNNVLGMRSGYTCCLANMHQGWTKFVSHLWYGSADDGITAMLYSPNEVATRLGKKQTAVTIKENTAYPFDDKIRFEITSAEPVNFPLHLRIPSWCKQPAISVNGVAVDYDVTETMVSISRLWKTGDVVQLQLPMQVSSSNWGMNSAAIERGPLVYALKLGEKWKEEEQQQEGKYFTVYPTDNWNYGVLKSVVDSPEQHTTVDFVKQVSNDFIWNLDHAPIEIKLKGKSIPAWKVNEDGVALQPVSDRTGVYKGKVEDVEKQITLVPYGCTKVRIVAFPVVK